MCGGNFFSRAPGPLADLHVAHLGAVDDETQRRADFVDAVISRSAGVEVEQSVDRIVDDPQDVGVSRHEERGACRPDAREDARVVAARIASDVGHEHRRLFAPEEVDQRPDAPHRAAVGIAADGPQRFEGGDAVGQFQRADVAGVPDLVDVREKAAQRVVEGAVRVRDESDAFHVREVWNARRPPARQSAPIAPATTAAARSADRKSQARLMAVNPARPRRANTAPIA